MMRPSHEYTNFKTAFWTRNFFFFPSFLRKAQKNTVVVLKDDQLGDK